jgi:asparagine synthase (glutamine-hydrolysing)
MCGIAGYLKNTSNNMDLGQIITGMTDAIAYRGPDHGDFWLDTTEHRLALGHRRLSIIDLSKTGFQPMHSHSERYVITYNGEIYNFKDIRSELETHNYSFNGTSDTEVLLAAIENWGIEKSLQKITGMFAFAVFDKKKRELTLARDRLGKKPLYFGWDSNNNFAFASELKAILSTDNFNNVEINQEAVNLYLKWRYVPDPYSIYKNIWKLPPSSYITLPLDQYSQNFNPAEYINYYWDFTSIVDQPKNNQTEEQSLNSLEDILEKSVSERMISDVPLGAFLSGGVDSSLIVSLMKKQSSNRISTFTIAFDDPQYNEADIARNIAKYLGTEHSEMTLSANDALNTVEYMSKVFDEPFGDPSAIPTYHVCRLAKEKMTVALSGDGGDESFGGYEFYNRIQKIMLILNIPKAMRSITSKLLMVIPLPGQKISYAQRQKLALMINVNCPDEIYPLIHSYWYSITGEKLSNESPTAYSNLSHEIKNDNVIERMMAFDSRMFLAGDVLTKVDRCSMVHSLEVRAPLLDHRVIECAWGLDFNMKIRGSTRKYALRKLLERHLPSNLINSKKQGFSIPHSAWLKNDLKDWAEHLFSENTLNKHNLISPHHVIPYWQAHKDGKCDYGHYLWTIACLQSWAEQWR